MGKVGARKEAVVVPVRYRALLGPRKGIGLVLLTGFTDCINWWLHDWLRHGKRSAGLYGLRR